MAALPPKNMFGVGISALVNNSMVDTLHRHSELSASDGSPDAIVAIDADGKVGINKSPAARVDIDAGVIGASAKAVIIEGDIETNAGVYTQTLNIQGHTPNGEAALGFGANSLGIIKARYLGTDNSGILDFYTREITAAPVVRMTILNTGRVGIGTDSPDTKLQVVGDCKFGDDDTNFTSISSAGNFSQTGSVTAALKATTIAGTLTQNAITQHFSGIKTLVDNTPTDFVEIACTTGQLIGGVMHYTIKVVDGTDFQCHSGSIAFCAVNKAGTLTLDVEEQYGPANEAEIVTAGTLTDDFAGSDGTNKLVLSCDADTSLTGTITLAYTVVLHSTNVITAL